VQGDRLVSGHSQCFMGVGGANEIFCQFRLFQHWLVVSFWSFLFTDCLQLCIPGSVVCLDTRDTMTQCQTCEIRKFCPKNKKLCHSEAYEYIDLNQLRLLYLHSWSPAV